MCRNPETFQDNREKSVQDYHIHIYFKDPKEDLMKSEFIALDIANYLKVHFTDDVKSVSKVPIVGPHLQRNYEVDITKEGFGKIVSWLQVNNRGLSILVHPETGDVRKDHLEHALWLGPQLGVNEGFFANRIAQGQAPQPLRP